MPDRIIGGGDRVDADRLARELTPQIQGDVRFDAGFRALYATDGSNYRQVPIGIVCPRDTEDVIETFALCRQFGAPIRSEEHTSELQSRLHLVCRLLLEKKNS